MRFDLIVKIRQDRFRFHAAKIGKINEKKREK
jgi:hypothetical protein